MIDRYKAIIGEVGTLDQHNSNEITRRARSSINLARADIVGYRYQSASDRMAGTIANLKLVINYGEYRRARQVAEALAPEAIEQGAISAMKMDPDQRWRIYSTAAQLIGSSSGEHSNAGASLERLVEAKLHSIHKLTKIIRKESGSTDLNSAYQTISALSNAIHVCLDIPYTVSAPSHGKRLSTVRTMYELGMQSTEFKAELALAFLVYVDECTQLLEPFSEVGYTEALTEFRAEVMESRATFESRMERVQRVQQLQEINSQPIEPQVRTAIENVDLERLELLGERAADKEMYEEADRIKDVLEFFRNSEGLESFGGELDA